MTTRLNHLKRESDTFAYVDKNEFAFILENIQSEDSTATIADRLLSAFSNPIEVDGKKLKLHTTISVCKVENQNYLAGINESGEILDILLERKIISIS